jgi:dienelactone hydrolase
VHGRAWCSLHLHYEEYLVVIVAFFTSSVAFAAPQVIDTELRDTTRDRAIPIRMRVPSGDNKAPLVIFSHGLGGSIDGGKAWGEHWSANGYFVIHVQHPGSDQEIMKRGVGAPLARLKRGANGEQLIARTQDVRFTLDELTRRKASGDKLYARIDLDRIAMTGHSFGAMTTMALADMRYPGTAKTLVDPRFNAFIALSPQAVQANGYGEITKPMLVITGTIDGDMIGSGATPDKRAATFDRLPAGDKYRVIFENGDHMVFNGGAIHESEVFTRMIENKNARTDAATSVVIVEKTKLTTLKFLDAYIKGDNAARAWLARDAVNAIGATGVWSKK